MANCLGGTGNFTCAFGTLGALCEVCDIYSMVWNISFANSDTFSCAPCNSVKGNSLKDALMVTFTLFSILLSIIGTYKIIINDL